MKYKILKDETTFNRKGIPGGRETANKGDVINLPPNIGESLVNMGRAERKQDGRTPEEVKDYAELKSTEMLANEAAEEMGKFDSADEIDAFIEGDERVTVQKAAKDRKEELNA